MADATGQMHAAQREESSFFIEKAECLTCIRAVASCEDAEANEKQYERVCRIFEKYQEQPQLLDPHLEEMITIVMEKARVITDEMKDVDAFHKIRMARADFRLFGVRQRNRLIKEATEK